MEDKRSPLDFLALTAAIAESEPDAVAVRAEGDQFLTFAALDSRSNRLGRALASRGVRPGERVALLCCDEHAPDLAVAYLGVRKAGARAVVLPVAMDAGDLATVAQWTRPRVILACHEGVEAWRGAGVLAGLVVGDDTGVVWWKALELRESPEPFRAPEADDPPPDLVAQLRARGGWALVELSDDDVTALADQVRPGCPWVAGQSLDWRHEDRASVTGGS